MVYESLSSILLLLIAAILILGWLPGRTMRGMKHASEHQQDRMSASLHLVDESTAERFGDVRPHKAKGLVMQPQRDGSKARQEEERIRQVRQLRRAAARRRRILALSLLVIGLVIGIFSYVFAFSFAYCLLPFLLLIVVMVSGAHASAQARRWEERLAKRQSRKRSRPYTHSAATSTVKGTKRGQERELTTDALSQQDIKMAIMLAKKRQEEALLARTSKTTDKAKTSTKSESEPLSQQQTAVVSRQSEGAFEKPKSDAKTVESLISSDKGTASTQEKPAFTALRTPTQEQTLLSFTMGQARQGKLHSSKEPVSLEIKSAKQVSKAVPKKQTHIESSKPSNVLIAPVPGTQKRDHNSQPDDFHMREIQAAVDAPELSEDSLGKVGIEAILARRSNG